MKKIISFALVMVLTVGCLFAFTGCGEKKPTGTKLSLLRDTYLGKDAKVSVDFYYPENAGIEVTDETEYRKVLKDQEENYKIEMWVSEDSTYMNNKESDKEWYEDKYKEFKLGKYDAYRCDSSRSITVKALLEEISETTLRYITIEIDPISQAGNDDSGVNFFDNNEEVKSIVNSLTYNGVIDAEGNTVEE